MSLANETIMPVIPATGGYGNGNTLNGNFRSLDNAVCQLGYQTQAGFNQSNVTALQVPAPYNVVPPVGGVPCPGGVV